MIRGVREPSFDCITNFICTEIYTHQTLELLLHVSTRNGCHQQEVLPVQGQPPTRHPVHTYRITRTQPILGFLDDRQTLVKTEGAPKIYAVDILVF